MINIKYLGTAAARLLVNVNVDLISVIAAAEQGRGNHFGMVVLIITIVL